MKIALFTFFTFLLCLLTLTIKIEFEKYTELQDNLLDLQDKLEHTTHELYLCRRENGV